MKRLLGLVGLLVITGCAQPFQAARDVSLTHPWSGFTRVEVRTTNGSVDLGPGPDQAVQITGRKTARGATMQEAETIVDQIVVFAGPLDGRANTLLVEVRVPAEFKNRSGANLTIRVPEPCAAQVTASNGSVSVSRMNGEQILATSNGSVSLADSQGKATLATSNGRVRVTTHAGCVTAETSNGSVEARAVTGDIDAHTSNGHIDLGDIAGSVSAETSNGDVLVTVAPPEAGRVHAETSNGSVHIRLPRALLANFTLSTSNGRVALNNLDESKLTFTTRAKTRVEAHAAGASCTVTGSTTNGSATVEGQ